MLYRQRLYGGQNRTPFTKDAFHDYLIKEHRPAKASEADSKTPTEPSTELPSENGTGDDNGDAEHASSAEPTYAAEFVNPDKEGTKAAAHYFFPAVPGKGGCVVVRLKLTRAGPEEDQSIVDEEVFDDLVEDRRVDSDEFYSRVATGPITDDLRNIMRQALSGMLWTKQYYEFIQKDWIQGDSGQPPPPPERQWVRNRASEVAGPDTVLPADRLVSRRNGNTCTSTTSCPCRTSGNTPGLRRESRHQIRFDISSHPLLLSWDTAFHCIPLAMVDPAFAKKQLDLMTREWYMKPDGALPAYEWNFSDVNPPVHAWSTFRVFKIERKLFGREDLDFLERVFQKLLLNFTWWVNRKDAGGNNVFEGGFLGLDNIGPFNRSEPLPTGGTLRQADGTAWMAFFSLNMLNIALELAKHNPTYEDIASKFFEHFLFIADAMTFHSGEQEESLWNEQDGFYYDAISWGPGNSQQLPVHSMVGLIPLYATLTLEPQVIKRFPGFKKRMDWFIENRPEISERNIANIKKGGRADRKLLALASKERLVRILEKMLDEKEFLSDYGVRS